MATASQSLESYKHKYAKDVLVDWLRSSAAAAGFDNQVRDFGLSWKVNRPGSSWGIFDEYPISDEIVSGCSVLAWDETWWCRVPTFEEMLAEGSPPEAILDVAIQEKGAIVYGFEVKHTHAVNDRKKRFLADLHLEVFEIEAEWILRQVSKPENLKCLNRYGRAA